MRPYLRFLFTVAVATTIANHTLGAPLDRQEELSAHADGVLKHLGQYLTGKLEKKKLAADLSSSLDIKIYIPIAPQTNIHGGLALTTLAEKPPGGEMLTSLDQIKTHWGGKILRTKFKIIELRQSDPSSDQFTTRQLVSLFLQTPEGFREINTEWQAQWNVTKESVRLVSLSGSIANEAHLKSNQLLFRDLTDSLLRLNSTDTAMVKQGANHWLPRLERAAKPEFFALSGVSVADVNGDGREDIYLCQLGGLPNMLFIQHGDGTFSNQASAWEVDFHDNSTCALMVDFDNDGDQDMALATASGLAILENNGEGKFLIKKLHRDIQYAYSLCAADYDRDGLVDLYACRYYGNQTTKKGQHSVQGNIPVPHPVYDARNGGRNTLLKNTGKLGFQDVTEATGLTQENNRFTYAAMWEDWDNDGDQDLYVANDFGGNNLYRNDSGRFVDVTALRGLGTRELSMGVCAGDFNGDGWPDIHVCNMFSSAGSRVTRQQNFKTNAPDNIKKQFQTLARGNSLFHSRGQGAFTLAGNDAGITVGRWSWASMAPDINNDGWDDLLVANGFITGKQPDDL